MSVNATIIVSLLDREAARLMYDHEMSKPSHGPVYAFFLTVDPENDELSAHPRDCEVLRTARSVKKIIVGAHSSPNGSTLQFDPVPNLTVGQRTRHHSEVVRFIASNLPTQDYDPAHPLRISLRSCCGAVGQSKAVASKMQREFELAFRIPCTITARNGYLFIGKPGYVVSENEYAFRLVQKNLPAALTCTGNAREHYLVPEDQQYLYHKAAGSKSQFFTDPATGAQVERDAYAHNAKYLTKIKNLCDSLRNQSLETHPEILEPLQAIEAATRDLTISEPTAIHAIVVPAFKKIKKMIGSSDELSYTIDSVVAYAKKHTGGAKPRRILPPITPADRANYLTHDQIIVEKLGLLNVKLLEIAESHPGLSALFLEPKTGLIDVLKTYYKYQLKNELKTDHVDALVAKLSILLSKATSPYDPLSPEQMRDAKEFKDILHVLIHIEEQGEEEGIERARSRGPLSGFVHRRELIRASTAKRRTLCEAIKAKLETFVQVAQEERPRRIQEPRFLAPIAEEPDPTMEHPHLLMLEETLPSFRLELNLKEKVRA